MGKLLVGAMATVGFAAAGVVLVAIVATALAPQWINALMPGSEKND